MKYYIIAGEASGDLHGSNLMESLFEKDPRAEIRFWGGDLMQQAGGTLVRHYRELAFMGFAEVILNLKTILRNIKQCKQDILEFAPDALIFIDYPGFNMRIAKWAKAKNFKTFYYVSPQIWAWKENRIKDIKRDVDKMFVILPFEKTFYEGKHDFAVEFVGHPLLDAIANRPYVEESEFKKRHELDNRKIIALLPGSRKQEISKMLEVMLEMVPRFEQYQFVIAGAPGQESDFYKQFTKSGNVKLIMNQTYDLLSVSHAALVTSGTATLETALFRVPEVVCYKGNWISYQIAKKVITLKYISLVNLIMDREIVAELIQNEFNPDTLEKELKKLLEPATRNQILDDFDSLQKNLGGSGASNKTAALIVQNLSE